jgi:hypothetical protein
VVPEGVAVPQFENHCLDQVSYKHLIDDHCFPVWYLYLHPRHYQQQQQRLKADVSHLISTPLCFLRPYCVFQRKVEKLMYFKEKLKSFIVYFKEKLQSYGDKIYQW